jgi:hypothetical protein
MAVRKIAIHLSLLGFGALGLAACAGVGDEPPGAPAEPKIERLGQYLYMVPVARDPRGCVVYLAESPLRRNDRSPYWRVDKGHFSTDPKAARCA